MFISCACLPVPGVNVPSSRMVRVRRRSAARGVNHLILRSLRDGNPVNFFNQSSLSSSDTIPVTMALINARSLSNKTFILNDLFASNKLDFLFVTETWLKGGDMSSLSELSSAGCSFFFSTPRSIGRGGGLAVVFKEKFKCRLLPLDSFCSFKSQLITLNSFKSVLCVLIYRPPNSHGDFIQEFSELLSAIVPSFDKILILGDFNIHVCCPSKPLVRDFFNLLESFDLLQCVFGPTHEHGHTLDLVLSLGFSVDNLKIVDTVFSDHKTVLFSANFPCDVLSNVSVPVASRVLTPHTASSFSAAFEVYPLLTLFESPCHSMDLEELVNQFNASCSDILDVVAPFKAHRKNGGVVFPELIFFSSKRVVFALF